MPVIRSQIDPGAAGFRDNAHHLRALVDDLHTQLAVSYTHLTLPTITE